MEKISDFYLNKGSFSLSIKTIEHPESGIVLVAGDSGSGKTSFMRALAGLEKENARFNWTYEVSERSFHFQDIKVFSGLSLLENLTLVNKDKQKAEKLLYTLDLIDKKNKLASTLSGGEMQRLGFLRAFMNNAKLIFLDEPFGQVNFELRKKMYNFLNEVKKDGSLIFVSTHIKNELIHDFEIKIS